MVDSWPIPVQFTVKECPISSNAVGCDVNTYKTQRFFICAKSSSEGGFGSGLLRLND